MVTSTRPRLLLIDGHSVAYRAFFALPVENFSTVTGQPTNAVFGFTSMLINVLRDEEPTHLAVTFDVSRSTFRTEAFADYKAGRSETPQDFKGQLSLVKDILDALAIPVIEKEGYEADDVIGTLTMQAAADGFDVLICSGDRDVFQLVSDRVTVLYPRRGVSDLARMTPAAVEARYGIPPSLYRDLAALVGESSDNLAGVPGVGPKTAAKWLQKYGSLQELVARVDELPGKVGDAVREHLASVLRNKQLNGLVCDLALPLHPSELARRPWDRDTVHAVFDALEFRVLRERLYATLTSAEPEAEEGFTVEGGRLEPGALSGWLAAHTVGDRRTGVHVVGQWGAGTGDVTGLALAAPDGAGAYLDPSELNEVDDAALGVLWVA